MVLHRLPRNFRAQAAYSNQPLTWGEHGLEGKEGEEGVVQDSLAGQMCPDCFLPGLQ